MEPQEQVIQKSKIEEVFNRQKEWSLKLRKSTAIHRISNLNKMQDWIQAHKEDIRKAVYADFKKPFPETDLSEIFVVTSEINHAIKHLGDWMKPKSVSTPLTMVGSKSNIQYEPKGAALIIAPWNFPFNLAMGPLVSALAAGCTAIVKPSEMTPHTSALIRRLVEEVFEPELVAVFEGDVEVSQMLLAMPFDHIFFTGSPSVGKIVMKAAAENLSSVTLELGGKSPAIIDRNVDIVDAATKVAWGKFLNCGQTCVAPDYVLVHEEVKDAFIEELSVQMQKMYDPKSKGIENSRDYGRIVNRKHWNRLNELFEDGTSKGAKIIFGGNSIGEENYFEPTLMSEVKEDMKVIQEEIFGPILPIISYSGIEEAIEYINLKPKPLSLYVFSNENHVPDQVLQETSAGAVVINDCVIQFLQKELPFGGVNTSGFGKAHGYFGFLAFSNEKAVMKQRIGLTASRPLYPPYGFSGKKILKALLKWF